MCDSGVPLAGQKRTLAKEDISEFANIGHKLELTLEFIL